MRREGHSSILLALLLIAGLYFGSDWIASRAVAETSTPQSKAPPHRHKTLPPSEITLPHSLAGGPALQITVPPVGLSVEYPVMAQDLGSGACPPAALVAELRKLGSPPLELGGASQDLTAPNGALPSPPSSWETASLYSLPAAFWSQLHCLLSETADPLTAGINMKTGQLPWAAQMAAGAQSAATNGLDFSLGNEPDIYSLPNYSELSKGQADEEVLAVSRYLQLATSLQQAIGGAPVIGPELAIAARWQHQLPRIISQLHDTTVGVHLYPLSACGSAQDATVRELLSARSAELPHSLAWVVADANAAHVPAILTESNSASCGGKDGVSDSPAAAVWAMRFVLTSLKTGFREVRFHFSGGPYDPFIVHGSEVLARPLESALVALNEWLSAGTSLQTIAGVRGLVATAVSGAVGKPQLILDDETSKAQTVVLRGEPSVNIDVLSSTSAGLHTTELSSSQDRIKLVVQSNSVVAVLPSS